jgi:hypothetical protein
MKVFARELALTSVRRTCFALFVLAIVSSAYFVQGVGMNQNSRFDLVRAIVDDGTVSIDGYEGNTMDKSTRDGHFYSDKAPGLSFASIPAYMMVELVGWPSPERAPTVVYVLTVAVVGVTSGVAAAALFLTLLAMSVPRVVAAATTVSWLLGTNAFGYLTMYYSHQFVGALLICSFALLYAAKDAGDSRRAAWTLPVAGLLGSWAAISEYPAAIAGLLLFVYGARVLGPRRMVPFVVASAFPVVLLLLYNAKAFGSPFALSYGFFAVEATKKVIDNGVYGVGMPRLTPLFEILFGEMRGLLPLSPFLILAVPGGILMAKDPKLLAEAWLVLALCLFFILLNAGYLLWHGGAGMGPRYVVPMLPFAVIFVARALAETGRLHEPLRTRVRWGSYGLMLLSIVTCTMTVAVMPEFLNDRVIRAPGPGVSPDMLHPLRTFVIPSFVRGYLSVKGTLPDGRMGIASTAPGHEWDAYNLGEAMGLRGLASLVPLAAVWACVAAAILAPERKTKDSRG